MLGINLRGSAAPKRGPAPRRPPHPNPLANNDHFEIEAIVAERPATATAGAFFLVKWKDCPEARNEWVPLRDLDADGAIATFRQLSGCGPPGRERAAPPASEPSAGGGSDSDPSPPLPRWGQACEWS